MPIPASVDDDLSALTDEQRVAVQALRETIVAAAPMATDTIAYQMPAFPSHGGRSLAAYRKHCSMFPASQAVVDALGDELTPYLAAKGTIRFPADRPIPIDTVRRIIEVRVAENAATER